MKRRPIAFVAPDEMHDKVSKDAARRGISKSQNIRRIVNDHYENETNIPGILCFVVQAQKDVGALCEHVESKEGKELIRKLQEDMGSMMYMIGGGDEDAHSDNI